MYLRNMKYYCAKKERINERNTIEREGKTTMFLPVRKENKRKEETQHTKRNEITKPNTFLSSVSKKST